MKDLIVWSCIIATGVLFAVGSSFAKFTAIVAFGIPIYNGLEHAIRSKKK
ncbi:MAG: hypothetical protein AAB729_01315 [Patescibacteria group bacterium]